MFIDSLKDYIMNNFLSNKYILGPNWAIIIPNKDALDKADKENPYHSSIEKECIICGSKFSFGQSRKVICGECKLIAISEGSGEPFEFQWNCSGTKRKMIIDAIKNKEELHLNNGYSDSNMARNSYGTCPYCGNKNVKIYNGRCENCFNKELNGPIECSIHGHQNHSFAGRCILCINNNKNYEEQSKKRTETILELIENNEIDHWPGYTIPNFIDKNNILNYFDKSINQYVPWEDYKAKFDILNIDFALPDGFKLYPTFRTQESDNWNRARNAFEQSLVDANINWFVYIKFYIDKNGNIKPLVVVKSGSLNVNINGSDVSFSVDVNDGPARRFLNDKNLQWCKTQIAILPCFNEAVAYEIESKIVKEYALFES